MIGQTISHCRMTGQLGSGGLGIVYIEFTSELIYDFHWSFEGKQLAMVRGHTDADVVLIRDARQ